MLNNPEEITEEIIKDSEKKENWKLIAVKIMKELNK